jgi:hypothetical protein
MASPELVEQAKRQTGIETDKDLIEFALATGALEDDFAETFKESRGEVDRELKLGFRGRRMWMNSEAETRVLPGFRRAFARVTVKSGVWS